MAGEQGEESANEVRKVKVKTSHVMQSFEGQRTSKLYTAWESYKNLLHVYASSYLRISLTSFNRKAAVGSSMEIVL